MFPESPQFEAALQILADLRAAGYEAYLAGGCVRDLLLGRTPHDYDVATSATPDVVLRMFPRTLAVGAHFGVVLVSTTCASCGGTDSASAQEELTPAQAGLAPPQVVLTEVATFRSDGVYSDGRHPDGVRYTLSAEEDVQRRDFTINGLLLDPSLLFSSEMKDSHPSHKDKSVARVGHPVPNSAPPITKSRSFDSAEGRFAQDDRSLETTSDLRSILRSMVVDHVGGLADLDAGILRAIGSPELRFEEDHLRMLRGVRFAARFGFAFEAQTADAIRQLAAKTAGVSRERVRDELTKMLTEGHARQAFELLDQTGLLTQVLPEIARMKGVEQPPQFHPEGDVWIHTLGLLAQLEAGCPLTLAWGALLHDVGKPATFRRAERIRFDGHVEVGVAIAADICRRFRFSNDETRQILALIENHMRFGDAQRMKASTLKRFFRLEDFEQHLALHRMDCLAGSGNLDHWSFVQERYRTMPEETVRPKPLLSGRELIAAGYTPGPAFKEILHAVEDAQLEGLIRTPEEALRLVRERYPTM